MNKFEQNLEYEDNEAIASSKPRNLKLIFPTRVLSPIYTGRNIIGENNEPIQIMLVDSDTDRPVKSGRAASLKVKIVLIRGDFCDEIWTHLDFKKNVVINLKKKRNLLLGDLSLVLKNGSGIVGKIRFKHDSKPLKNIKFRLGAIVDDDLCRYEIKEGLTNVFEVKDRRNESKLSKSLSPNDGVWQIMNISKTGRIRESLVRNKISTVTDFLDMYDSCPRVLEEICQIKGKKWEVAVNHAKTSRLENVLQGNTYGLVGSTSRQTNTMPSVHYEFSNQFGDNFYKPHPCTNDSIGNMVVDHSFSTHDVEIYYGPILEFRPCQAYRECEINASHMSLEDLEVRCGLARKRWMKLRATIWFWMITFAKKVSSCVGAV